MQAKLRQKAGSLARQGWRCVCNGVCDGHVTRSVTRQSKAQHAKAPPQHQLFNAGQAAAKGGALARAGVGSVTRYVTAV